MFIAPDYPGMGYSAAPAPTVLRPTFDDVAAAIDAFIAQRAPRPVIFYMHDIGGPIGGATRRAGLAGRLVHDLRRTAARDFRRRGVSEGDIMKLCGWKTRSMFDRYNIIDEVDLAQAVAKRFEGNGKLAANSQASSEREPSGSSSSTR